MKALVELEKGVRDNEQLKQIGMEIAQYLFSQSQQNLVEPVPWGDNEHPSDRSPSVITNQGLLLQSGVPPYWQDENTIVFRYDAVHAPYVEWGTPPHPVGAKRLVGWVNKKLGVNGKQGLRAAYAIATKIRKEGMDPHPFVRPAAHKAEQKFGFVRISVE